MRFSLVCLALVFMTMSPAMAGRLMYQDGQGAWQSTRCAIPSESLTAPVPADMAADDLNNRMNASLQHRDAVQRFMQCLRDEATRDAQAAADLVLKDSTRAINAAAQTLTPPKEGSTP